MAKRVFRLKKESSGYTAGQLYEQEYETARSRYVCININETAKYPLPSGVSKVVISPEAVEDNPDWYEEVFKVMPMYATKEEMKRFTF